MNRRLVRVVVMVFISTLLISTSSVSALTNEDRRRLTTPFFDPANTSAAICATMLPGSDNQEKTWNFLIGKGFSAPQAAGIMGNLQSESGGTFDPRVVEFGFPNSQGVISKPGDPSTWDDEVPPNANEKGQPGYGIVQWTAPNRKEGLKALAIERGTAGGDLGTQLEFLWQELNTSYKSSTLDPILATDSYEEASDIFLTQFERPANIPGNTPVRRAQALNFLTLYGSTGEGSSSSTGSTIGCGTQTSLEGVQCPAVMEAHPSIPGYYRFPDAPAGEYDQYGRPAAKYGSQELVCALYSVAMAYHEAMDGRSKMRIGDLNATGHKSHDQGIAVDLSAWGELQAASHNKPWKGEYSTEATILIGKLFADTGILRNIWWCDPGDGSTEEILSYAREKGLEGQIKCISGHADHFHVDIYAEFRLSTYTP